MLTSHENFYKALTSNSELGTRNSELGTRNLKSKKTHQLLTTLLFILIPFLFTTNLYAQS